MKLTVFTPTYNRGYILPKLYESLKKQTCFDFVWLIVDDGSDDNTKEIVDAWISEGILNIRYYYQKNQGKSMAHNYGVELANTELFVCVDSDDYLVDCAVEKVINIWKGSNITDVGILAFRNVTTIEKIEKGIHTTLKNAYDDLGLRGDTMLIFRTDIIQKYRFPNIPGEKFVPEGYLYDQIDKDGTLILYPTVLYMCEYLEDGYTENMAELLKNNPKGYLVFIEQRLKIDKTFKQKFFDSIRYVCMALVNKNKRIIRDSVYPGITFLSYVFGMIFYIKRYKGIK